MTLIDEVNYQNVFGQVFASLVLQEGSFHGADLAMRANVGLIQVKITNSCLLGSLLKPGKRQFRSGLFFIVQSWLVPYSWRTMTGREPFLLLPRDSVRNFWSRAASKYIFFPFSFLQLVGDPNLLDTRERGIPSSRGCQRQYFPGSFLQAAIPTRRLSEI